MRCEEFQPLIEEYLDSELTESTAGEVARHLDDCASCAEVAGKLGVEREMYSRYEPDLKVTPDLWAGVHARIATERRVPGPKGVGWLIATVKDALAVPRVSSWATAALVLLAIGSTAVFMKYMESGTPPPHPEVRATVEPQPPTRETMQTVSSPPAAGDTRGESDPERPKRRVVTERTNQVERSARQGLGPKTPHQLVNEAEQKYLAAIAMLSRNASRRRSQMDAVSRAKLDQAIASINRTIAGTRKAVREHPDDPIAVQYMLTAYARKVDVLREMAAQ
jgi:Putative zinc-finger